MEILSKRKLFRLLFIGYTFAFLPLGLLASILSVAGIVPVNINNKEVYGILGGLVALIYIPLVGILMSGLNWILLVIGMWIYNSIVKFISILKQKSR